MLVSGFNPSEKYEFVNWDDDIPNIWKVIKAMFQTTNQSSHFEEPGINHFSRTTRSQCIPCSSLRGLCMSFSW